MYPVALDLSKIAVLLVGEGPAFERRRAQLEQAGAKRFADTMKDAPVVMVAGLSQEASALIASEARAAGKLVNVEDVPELCDFIFTAHIRRGDLLIAVSTGGASPTLAKRVRDRIGQLFDEKWVGYTQAAKEFRDGLRAKGAGMKEVASASERFLEEKGWLKP